MLYRPTQQAMPNSNNSNITEKNTTFPKTCNIQKPNYCYNKNTNSTTSTNVMTPIKLLAFGPSCLLQLLQHNRHYMYHIYRNSSNECQKITTAITTTCRFFELYHENSTSSFASSGPVSPLYVNALVNSCCDSSSYSQFPLPNYQRGLIQPKRRCQH